MTILPPEQRKFSVDWFWPRIASWKEHVVPRLQGVSSARWLEIGVYEGKSALWTLDNVLCGPDAKIYCLDPFDPELPYLSLWAPNVNYETVFDANVNNDERVIKVKGLSESVLPGLRGVKLHGAYIDGEHSKRAILFEAPLVWDMLLPGGVLIFDDYGYKEMPEAKEAIDEFLSRPEVRHEILYLDFQAIVLKTS
jgi:hypothetical protein